MANALNDEYKKEVFLKINELLGNKDNGYVNGRTGFPSKVKEIIDKDLKDFYL